MNVFQLGKTWFSEKAGGGSDRVFAALTHHLPDPDTTVRGLVIGDTPSNGSALPGVTGVSRETDSLLSRWRAVRASVRSTIHTEEPDVITSHFALYAAPVLDIIGDTPFVVHFHGPWAAESRMEGESALKTRFKAAIERRVYRRGDRFVVLSETFRDILIDDYGVPSDRIHIIPGGVDVDNFAISFSREEARTALGWPTDRPTLLSVRRLVKRVGLGPLIHAVDRMRNRVPDILLMIAGKGPLRTDLETMIRDLSLEDHVQLLGFVPDSDLPTAYRAADVSVMPTQALEGFGLSAVESLAAGTPVVVTPIGGLPGIVQGLSHELLFADGTASTMAEHLTDLFSGKRALPGINTCEAYARSHYDWDSVAGQTRKMYRGLLSM